MKNSKIAITGFLVILSLSGEASQTEDSSRKESTPLPVSMLGTWQVMDVLVDKENSSLTQGRDDKYKIPKFSGRIFTITSKQLSINTSYDDPCANPRILANKITADKLISKSISSRYPAHSAPTPRDMRLPLSNNAPVEALYLVCEDKLMAKDLGARASDDRSNAVWFIEMGNNHLIMSWHEETLLVLNRVPKDAKPAASFDCSKAGTNVEKTICSSIGLAAYDKSVTQTYKLALTYYQAKKNEKSTIAELKKTQREWLSQRNACGANVACLEKVMSERIGEINYDVRDYIYKNK